MEARPGWCMAKVGGGAQAQRKKVPFSSTFYFKHYGFLREQILSFASLLMISICLLALSVVLRCTCAVVRHSYKQATAGGERSYLKTAELKPQLFFNHSSSQCCFVYSELTKFKQACPRWEVILAVEDPVLRTAGL